MSHQIKNSVGNNVISKQWIYLKRNTLHRQCGLSQKVRAAPGYETVSFQCCNFCSVTKSCLNFLWTSRLQYVRPSYPSLSPWLCLNSYPLNRWCYWTISSSATPFSFYLQSFPASGSFPMSQLFALHGQSIGAPASASVLPMNIQVCFPLGLTGLISLQSKGLSRVFSNTIVQKHHTRVTFRCLGIGSWKLGGFLKL